MKSFRIPLTAILLFQAALAQPSTRLSQTVMLDETGIRNLGIETVAATETSFSTTVSALGEIEETCESHAVLSSRIAGRIVEVGIHEGEFTEKGEVLAKVESRQPGDPPPVIELTAPGSGLVIRSEVHLGAPVAPDDELLEIIDLSSVWVAAAVPQDHAPVLEEGLMAKIRVPAIKDGEFEAKFLRLGTKADATAGTLEAIFELKNPGNKLRPGMRAELALTANKREGVLSVPRAALQGEPSNRYVFIKDYEIKNAFVKTPVVTGTSNDERIEIVSGLFPGDEVVTLGSYALAFAGKGTASLKEALDAAHGHPHKEDGSDLTAAEIAAAAKGGTAASNATGITGSPLTLFLAIACGVLFVLLVVVSVSRHRSKA
jgi:multidrug efflux pump subunit AcrA (membrane-fusion protein)